MSLDKALLTDNDGESCGRLETYVQTMLALEDL
jgi:hypothetical protein